ncbi:MAG: efflux RND transporter periplasmic adaptor subunit [Pirellulaceae bacterium]
MSHRRLGILLVGALLAGPVGCRRAEAVVESPPIPIVTVTRVLEQTTQDYDEYIGRAEASEAVDIVSRVHGFLKTIDFQDGEEVQEGQPLFTIEPDEFQAIHQQSLSRVTVWESKRELAKAKLARNEVLLKSSAVSKEDYEETVAAVRESEASVISAQADAARTALDVKYTTIVSPLTGRIDRAFLTKGNFVTGGASGGTLLTRIVREQPIYVYFDVDEASLLRYKSMAKDGAVAKTSTSLRERQIPCLVQLANERDFPRQGTVDFASNQVDASTGTIRLRGVLPNDDRALVAGMFVRVRISIGKAYEALMVPEQAIATDQSVQFVYVVDTDGTAVRRTVELGRQQGTWRVIRSGLAAGERVITRGLQRVRPNEKVEAQEEESAAPADRPVSDLPPQPETGGDAAAASPRKAD